MKSSRRSFLKGAGAAVALPWLDLRAQGVAAPSERINVACCGIGFQGAWDVEEMAKTGLVNIVALCDTHLGADFTAKILKKYPNAKRYKDFRKMFDELGNQIDAVTAGVPDHSHFPIAMMAMKLGKGIYTEKPMGHTFREIGIMMAAAAKYKVATQMGNQGHSREAYFQFRDLVRKGIIKDVTKIVAHMNSSRRWHKWKGNVTSLRAAMPLPEGLDWDTWLGTVPFHAYHRDYVQGDWRCWYDFGNGALGDWGAHIFDTAHEFLRLGMPEGVDVLHMDGHSDFVFPMNCTLKFKFGALPDRRAVDLYWYEGQKNIPELPTGFTGSEAAADVPKPGGGSSAVAKLNPGKEIYLADGTVLKGASHASTLSYVGRPDKLNDFQRPIENHHKNFVRAVKGEVERCNSDFSVAGPLSQVLCLGCIAQRLNTNIRFDPKTQQIIGNATANNLLAGPPPRKGWEQFYVV
ncbi:MAG: Gfo/Idh/MocA family oxidoreductase [Kiritimatiellae bacterium]|nr:Gfo/Idh/MocA family oxidoreductase [Kiritimatiellia bacterium]